MVHCDRVVNINGGEQSVHIYQNNDDREVTTASTMEKSAFSPKSSPRNSPTQQTPQYNFNFNEKVFDSNSNGNILSIGNQNTFYKSMEQSASTLRNSLAETTISNENQSGENREHYEAEEIEADLLRAQRRQNNLG